MSQINKDCVYLLKVGDCFTIYGLELEKSELIKILSMGVCEGEKGQLLLFSPLKKTCLLKIRGSTIALSSNLAEKILVKKEVLL